MSGTATEQYVSILTRLKKGDIGLLRTHAGRGLDESVDGFDLFTGLWWPLREKSQSAPRREVAWLIAKVYAVRPLAHSAGDVIARQLRKCHSGEESERERFRQKFDEMLMQPLDTIGPYLRWALNKIASNGLTLDWVKLTDDLSIWERESTRRRWAEQFLGTDERGQIC